MLEVRLIDDRAALGRLADEWSALVDSCSHSEPTQSPLWLINWWDVFQAEGQRALRVLTVRDTGRLVGVVPLLSRPARYRGAIPFRRLELLGSGEAEEDETVSDYLGVIAAPGWEARVAAVFAGALVDGRLGRWDELLCPRLDGTAPMPDALAGAFAARGLTGELEPSGDCHYVALPQTWGDYLGSLSSSHRYKVKRSLRELESWADGDWSVHNVTSRAEVGHGFEVLMRLHGERWGDRGGLGAFASPYFREFHRRVIYDLFDRGALRLRWLSVRGKPVAVNYSILWDGKIHFYQSGRTLDAPPKVTLGIALHALSIRDAIDEGLREYDFLGGDARYKTVLATHTRQLVSLRVTPAVSIRETARGITESGVHVLRRARNRLRALTPSNLAHDPKRAQDSTQRDSS